MRRNKLLQSYPIILPVTVSVITLLFISLYSGMTNDEGMWSYIGRIWLENDMPPYKYSVENKTPGIFIIHAISHYFFGIHFFPIRVLGLLSIILTGYFLYKIFAYLTTQKWPLLIVIYSFLMGWDTFDGILLGHTEIFMNLFSVLCFYLFFKLKFEKGKNLWQYLFLSGISMGMAIAFKQIALTTIPVVLFLFYIHHKASILKTIVIFSSGILVATFISIIPLLLSGVSIVSYIEGAWLILLTESSYNTIDHFSKFIEIWTQPQLYPLYPLIILGLFSNNLKKEYKIVTGLWFLFDFIGANLSGNYWGHQLKQILPSLSVILVLCTDLYYKIKPKLIIHMINIVLIILLFPIPIQKLKFVREVMHERIVHGFKNSKPYKMGKWLENQTDSKDYTFVFGQYGSPIQSYSNRLAPSNFFNVMFLQEEENMRTLLHDLHLKPPKYILIDSNFYIFDRELLSFVHANYQKETTMNNYEIYLHN